MKKRIIIYALIVLLTFAGTYALIWWIDGNFYWYKEMLETPNGRGRFAAMFIITSLLSALICEVKNYLNNEE